MDRAKDLQRRIDLMMRSIMYFSLEDVSSDQCPACEPHESTDLASDERARRFVRCMCMSRQRLFCRRASRLSCRPDAALHLRRAQPRDDAIGIGRARRRMQAVVRTGPHCCLAARMYSGQLTSSMESWPPKTSCTAVAICATGSFFVAAMYDWTPLHVLTNLRTS